MQQVFKSFDIIIDLEEKKERVSTFKKLINSVSGLVKRPKKKSVKNMSDLFKVIEMKDLYTGQAIRIDNNDLNYRLIDFMNPEYCESNNKFNLMRDFEQLVKYISSLIEEPKEDKYEVEITIELPKPKKVKKVTTYEKITIMERWVKIGYQMYRRQFDNWTGEEFIIVDGDVYLIKNDRYGREYLA